MRQRQLENTQQNTLAQAQSKRGDAELALQQGEQSHRFGIQDQKQVEDALSEYHDAVDTGDPVRIGRATELLKRLGMNVGGQGAKPDLRALTGQSLLPNVKPSPDQLQALTGQPQNPIDEAVKTELQSRDALRAKNAAQPQDLSQDDFESQLINGPTVDASEHLQGNKSVTDPAALAQMRKMTGTPEETAEGEPPGVAEQTSQAQRAAAALPPRLPTQLLPTVISKNGKVLEESSGQAGRYSPMVSGVFEPFLQNENPEMAQAGQRAQQIAQKLISVDGVAPRDAIKMGMDYLNNEANRLNNLERTIIGSKAHVAAGVPGATPTFNPKTRQFFTNEMHESVQKFKNENIESGIRGYDSGLSALNSSNPASQNDAINQLIAARSGKTVSDRERAIYDNIAGVWNGIQKKFNMAAGQAMPEEMKGQLRALLSDAKNSVVQAREERAQAAEAYHRRKLMGAPPGIVENDAKGVGDAIRMSAGGDPNADLDQ